MDSFFTTPLMVTSVVFTILATVSVALRLVARKQGGKISVHADDWLIVASLMICWGKFVNTVVGAALIGVDKTTTTDILFQSKVTIRALWIEGFLMAVSLALVKNSVLHFYYRIFATKCDNTFRYSAWAMHAILVGWCVSNVVCQFLATDPISGSYDPDPVKPSKFHYDYNTWALCFAGMSVAFDLIILLFPLPVISKLHIDFKRKMTVIFIFWLGGFCCIAAGIRFYFLWAGIYKSTSAEAGSTYHFITNGYIWAQIEPNVSVVAACLPTYGPLFASGRSAQSLIRSLRSVFSMGGSSKSSSLNKSSLKKGMSTTGNSSQHALAHGSSGSEGYYELREQPLADHTGRGDGLHKSQTRVVGGYMV